VAEPRVLSVGYSREAERIEAVIDRGLKSRKLDFIPLSAAEALELTIQSAEAIREQSRHRKSQPVGEGQ